MSNSFAAKFDAMARRRFLATGLADAAVHKSKATNVETACVVTVDRNVEIVGQDMQIAYRRTVIGFIHSEIAAPAQYDTVTIGAEVFTLEAMIKGDESASQWVTT